MYDVQCPVHKQSGLILQTCTNVGGKDVISHVQKNNAGIGEPIVEMLLQKKELRNKIMYKVYTYMEYTFQQVL